MPPVQPLPLQPPGDTDLGIKEGAPDIRDFAKPLPGGGTIFDQLQPPVTSVPLIGGITPPSISPEEQARRDEQNPFEAVKYLQPQTLRKMFPDAPKPPRAMTADMQEVIQTQLQVDLKLALC